MNPQYRLKSEHTRQLTTSHDPKLKAPPVLNSFSTAKKAIAQSRWVINNLLVQLLLVLREECLCDRHLVDLIVDTFVSLLTEGCGLS